jgi:tRNA(fMet)-specific endonuclease VapC
MVCLDTTFVIDFIRNDKGAVNLFEKLKFGESITIASPSIMEVMLGVHLSFKPEKERNEIMILLSSARILPLGYNSALLAGKINAELVLSGETLSTSDIMIGAICKHNNQTLITRNKKHFEKIDGLKLETY